jgi:hypothetical protein
MARELKHNRDFDAYKVNFKGFGFTGSVQPSQVCNVDYILPETRLVYGGEILLSGHQFGDTLCFQVVDVNNILGYGAGLVLGEYLKDWNVAADTCAQNVVLVDYPTEISAGLGFRIRYTSTGPQTVGVAVNVYCVKNIT